MQGQSAVYPELHLHFEYKCVQGGPAQLKVLNTKTSPTPQRRPVDPLCPYLSGVHDSAHAHRQGHGGHLGEISVEEPSVGQDGVHGQRFHTGPGHQTGARLIEGNVSVGADACPGEMVRAALSVPGTHGCQGGHSPFPLGSAEPPENPVSPLLHPWAGAQSI